MSNPFNYLCGRCNKTLSLHTLYGRRAKCDDANYADFPIWQVVEAKRALGHKIPKSMSWAAFKDRAQWDRDARAAANRK